MTEQPAEAGLLSRLTPQKVAAFAVLAAVPAKALAGRLNDIDIWWHLKTGELIVANKALPDGDPFSYTAPGKEWVVQEWGAEVILHGLREAFGLWGIYAYRAVMLTVVYALFARLLVRAMGSGIATWALFALAAFAGASTWTERPNLMSFALFVVTLGLLERRDPKAWWFVPLAALWSNLHGMVILGIGLVLVVAAAEALKVLTRWPDNDPKHARRLWLVAGAGVLATFANPYGPGLLGHAFRLTAQVRDFVSEWQTPSFHEAGNLLFLALLIVTIAVLAMSTRRMDPTDLAMVLAFTVLSLYAGRNVWAGGIVLGLVAGKHLHPALGTIPRRSSARQDVSQGSAALLGVTGVVATVLGLTLVVAATMPRSDALADITGEHEYPLEAIALLEKDGVRVFAWDFWAGLVIHETHPAARVYIDLRWDFYGAELSERYGDTIEGQATWRENLDEFCTTHVLIRPNQPLATLLDASPDWTQVFEDRIPEGTRLGEDDEPVIGVIFQRTAPAPGCEEHPIPALV